MVEGSTLHRFTGTNGLVYRKASTPRDRQLKCTACQLPHRKSNLNCWANVHVGPAPAVLNASPGQLYNMLTGEYLGTFTFVVKQTWPLSRWTAGELQLRSS